MMPVALDDLGQAPPIEPATLDAVFGQIAAYYGAKLARHGATPRGVDWSCSATQWLRFVQLLKLCILDAPLSLIDVGCGYGALATFLRARHPGACVDYLGIDISAAMVTRAKRRHRGNSSAQFQLGRNCPRQADYAVASGIMNVTLGCPRPLWEDGVGGTLADLRRMGRLGFAVNFLTAAPEGSPPGMLYCTHPERWAGFCRAELGCEVEVLNCYGMREFTLLARYS
jgi:SAM-dependent methyltransferase